MPKPSRHLRLGLLWVVLLAFPLVAPNSYIVNLGVFFFINLILIASLNLIMGFGGQISLAHGAFYGLGAYASGVLAVKYGWSPWLAGPAALAITCAAALAIGFPALRLKGHYLAMATLGFNAILSVLFNELVPLTGGPNGLTGVPGFSLFGFAFNTDTKFFYLAWLAAGLVMLALLNLIDSRFGRGLRALSGSEVAADCTGIDTFAYKLIAFAASAVMAAVAGVLYVHFVNFASPETFSFFTSVFLVVMVALGGTGHYWGPIWAALIFTMVPELLRAVESLEVFFFGASMILVLLFFPNGVAGAADALLARLRSRRAAGA
ncbi:MAG: branched-chain amino acid ABC transporter permease [Rhodospirillaceae bacterium]|nr:branched-chain amino acid ABC transporter permease [Rhodospirillaceae bacterium]